jgi:ferric enterobactin transport system permease protein
VGASLGVAGALIQGHTRNPLADPGILGVNAGAALAVVSTFAVFGSISMFATTVAAFLGAVSATIIVFGLGRINGGNASPLTLTLSGAALSAVLNSITTGLILAEEANLDRMRFWTVGSVAGRGLDVFWGVLPFAVLGIVLAFASAPALNLLNLGDDVAQSLGVRTDRARLFGMVLISLLAGAATAMAGPVGFIGLIVPHLVRAITGPDYRWILPYSALLGATLMVLADVIGRIIARPGELPVGIVVAFIGAPLFFVLVFHRKGLAL